MFKNWDLLAEIDRALTLMDIDLMEWRGHLDMAALAGVGMPVELWTDDDPPRVITREVMPEAAGKEVRVMLRKDGKWGQVGTGTIDANGNFAAEITEEVPELSMHALRHFSLRRNLPTEPLSYETLVVMPGSGVVEIPRVELPPSKYDLGLLREKLAQHDIMELPEIKTSLKGIIPGLDLDNHPFFKGDDK